jgi:hypothetical protein
MEIVGILGKILGFGVFLLIALFGVCSFILANEMEKMDFINGEDNKNE